MAASISGLHPPPFPDFLFRLPPGSAVPLPAAPDFAGRAVEQAVRFRPIAGEKELQGFLRRAQMSRRIQARTETEANVLRKNGRALHACSIP